MEELRDTEGDLWLSRQGDDVWWSASLSGSLRETLQPSQFPSRDGAEVWVLEKPCQPWASKDREGRALKWAALHPKARDFLSTEATFQRLSADERDYAGYARALINGDSLESWHQSALFQAKYAEAKQKGGKTFSAKERSAHTLSRQVFKTIRTADGREIITNAKIKTTTLSIAEWERHILIMIDEQEGLCALSGMSMQFEGEATDKEMLASLDRVDSGGHYTPDNVQLVCRFINRWKRADGDQLVRRLLGVLRDHHRADL